MCPRALGVPQTVHCLENVVGFRPSPPHPPTPLSGRRQELFSSWVLKATGFRDLRNLGTVTEQLKGLKLDVVQSVLDFCFIKPQVERW